MDNITWLAIAAVGLHWALVIGLSVRIIMRRRPLGVLLAWMALILSVPLLGILIYLFIGESRVSERYIKRALAIENQYAQWKRWLRERAAVDWSLINPRAIPLQQQAESLVGLPALQGNRIELLEDCASIFQSLIDDIQHSSSTCHLEFYIWHPGGMADALLEALLSAADRGVTCRVLLDALGSKPFLRSEGARRLKDAGVELYAVMPVSLLTTLTTRADLRNHRKVVVIDGEIAYTGSQNLVDPRFFKQDAGVGEWIDAMVRIEGPVVESVGGTFMHDWEIVTGTGLSALQKSHDVKHVPERGPAAAQFIPSGPVPRPLAILQLILSTIYSAQAELIITTPYFVPDESLLTALMSAAHRGVAVTLVIPAKNDSRLVDFASRAVFEDLLAAGVQIAAFKGGLLHTKSITVDGDFCLFGSVNMDIRSLWLNFEVSLFIFNRDVTSQIRELQKRYISESDLLRLSEWRQRPPLRRFAENAVHLLAPIL
jgi:cardiolipin synthase